MDIKELKKENREIRKKFSRENKSFVIEVTYYIDQFQISKTTVVNTLEQGDFVIKSNKKKGTV